MEAITRIVLITTLAIAFNGRIKAQEFEINFDSMVIGTEYHIEIENGWETEGVLISNDSSSIIVRSKLKTFTIEKEQITDVIDLTPDPKKNLGLVLGIEEEAKDNLFISGGSGVNFAGSAIKDRYSPGIDFQLTLTNLVKNHYATRGSFEFAQSPAKVQEESYSYYENSGNGYYRKEGGDLNMYSFKFDFLLGEIRKTSKINAYAILGTGLTIVSQNEIKNTFESRIHNPFTNEFDYYSGTSKYNPDSYSQVPLEFGAGFGYKISDKVRLFGEAQYAFPFMYVGLYGIAFYNNVESGNPSVRIGAQFGLW